MEGSRIERPRRILCIDGGGIRGLIPALVLADLERRIAARARGPVALHRCFDIIAGTSTGGIIAAGLVAPAADGGAACSAADLVTLYREHGREIFPHDPVHFAERALGFPYSARPVEALLQRFIGERAWTADALTNVLLPAYDLLRRRAVFMAGGPDYPPGETSYLLHEAARATSAAPTYFRPERIAGAASDELLAIDGGVFANDPALAALTEARKLGWPLDRIELLSIGTGRLDKPYPTARRWTLLGWVNPFRHVPLLSILAQAGSSTISYQVGALLDAKRYTRVSFELPRERAIDDVSPAHLAEMTDVASAWIANNAALLDDWAARLVETPRAA